MEVFGNQITYALQKDTDYVVTIVRQDNLGGTGPVQFTSDSKGVLTIEIPEEWQKYYGWYSVEIATTLGEVVLIDGVSKVTQYATTAEILAYMQGKVNPTQAIEYERIARTLIDSITGTKFQFEHKVLTALGDNSDSLLLDERLAGQVFSIYENVVTPIYDDASIEFESYFVTRGNSNYSLWVHQWDSTGNALEEINRLEHTPTWSSRYKSPLFKYEYDYTVDAEFGWAVVPQDVKDATLLLVNDIACGNNRYSSKYIDSFRNGSASVDYFKEVIKGSGNLIVDNILSKYTLESVRAKVL
jgi:hypothetical protein